MDVMKKVPVREQDAKERATNFEEVCLGYNMEEAMEEASRCINCKNAQCVKGCPVAIDIPAFIGKVKTKIDEPFCAIRVILQIEGGAGGGDLQPVHQQPLTVQLHPAVYGQTDGFRSAVGIQLNREGKVILQLGIRFHVLEAEG